MRYRIIIQAFFFDDFIVELFIIKMCMLRGHYHAVDMIYVNGFQSAQDVTYMGLLGTSKIASVKNLKWPFGAQYRYFQGGIVSSPWRF